MTRHDVAAEQIVLGVAMLDHRLIDDMEIRAEDFYRPTHEQLWQVIAGEHRVGRPTDMAAIAQRISTIRGIEPGYLLDCVNAVPAKQNGPYYARVVSALAQLRRLEKAGNRLVQTAQDTPWDQAADALEGARAEVDGSEGGPPRADVDAVVRLTRAGRSATEIAVALGVSRRTVVRVRARVKETAA